MSKEKGLIIVKENVFYKLTSYFKNLFFGNRIKKQDIYENINLLEEQLVELKQQNKEDKIVQVSIKTTQNRIALLHYRANLKNNKKKSRTILVE